MKKFVLAAAVILSAVAAIWPCCNGICC